MPPFPQTPLASQLIWQLRHADAEPDIIDTLIQVRNYCEERLAQWWATHPRLPGSGQVEQKEAGRD